LKRPNVVLMVADDMGFSDPGCYGGEIRTPNLDALAARGVRFSQFYNGARCSPSRASLLTGLHPHQTGIGILTNDDRPRGYPGTLNHRCVTIAEVLKAAGYRTAMSGKWHLSADIKVPGDAWPTRRGFDRYFGTLTGCGSYFQPGTLTRGEVNAEDEALDPGFYYTDAISDEAAGFVRDCGNTPADPFFLYVAYTAPHWPLHARDEDLARYRGAFEAGWDELREGRIARQKAMGLIDAGTKLSARDPSQPAWHDEPECAWQATRMEAYAAQIDCMDQGIGRILAALDDTGARDDTLVIFLSDNGASDEGLPLVELSRFRERRDILRLTTRDGREVRIGNEPSIVPGGEDTYASYGRAWANLSNTPFRYYKRWVHEGGIACPIVVHWPAGALAEGTFARTLGQLTDILPTILEVTGASYPTQFGGNEIPACEGRSLVASLRGEAAQSHALYWEHTGNAAIRHGRWKLVRDHPGAWELYDLEIDRTELENLVLREPQAAADLAQAWARWGARVGVIDWEVTLDLYATRGQPAREAMG